MKKKSIIISIVLILMLCIIGSTVWFIKYNKEAEDVINNDVVTTAEPTEVPNTTEVPTPEPTEVPTPEPTEVPTPEPTEEPTPEPVDNTNPAFYNWVNKETEEADIAWFTENFGVTEAELRTWDDAKWQKEMDAWLNKNLHNSSGGSENSGGGNSGGSESGGGSEDDFDLPPAPGIPEEETDPGHM